MKHACYMLVDINATAKMQKLWNGLALAAKITQLQNGLVLAAKLQNGLALAAKITQNYGMAWLQQQKLHRITE